MEEFHAAEVQTLLGEIDRLQTYAARLVVHNDYLLKVTPSNALDTTGAPPDVGTAVVPPPASRSRPSSAARGETRTDPRRAKTVLPDLSPPWHHPAPAPPPEGSCVVEKLLVQSNVIMRKLTELETSAAVAGELLGELRRAAVNTFDSTPSGNLRRLACRCEPRLQKDKTSLVSLTERSKALLESIRGGHTVPEVDHNVETAEAPSADAAASHHSLEDQAVELQITLRELLRRAAVAATHGTQLVQVAAILEVTCDALGAAVERADRDQAQLRSVRVEAGRRLDAIESRVALMRVVGGRGGTATETGTSGRGSKGRGKRPRGANDGMKRWGDDEDAIDGPAETEGESRGETDDGDGDGDDKNHSLVPLYTLSAGKRRRPHVSSLNTAMALREARDAGVGGGSG